MQVGNSLIVFSDFLQYSPSQGWMHCKQYLHQGHLKCPCLQVAKGLHVGLLNLDTEEAATQQAGSGPICIFCADPA